MDNFSLSVQYGIDAPTLPRWRFRRWVAATLKQAPLPKGCERVELGLRLVDADEGRMLNHQFRDKDYATNVLTFEYGLTPNGTLTADIVLCLPVLLAEAKAQSKAPLHHAAHLTVHGVLHALGFDHIDDDQARTMEALETAILARLGIADPYA